MGLRLVQWPGPRFDVQADESGKAVAVAVKPVLGRKPAAELCMLVRTMLVPSFLTWLHHTRSSKLRFSNIASELLGSLLPSCQQVMW